MKALTVQQPWAWAIVCGGKDVENRTQAWSYRGSLAIHAGVRDSARGHDSPLVEAAVTDASYFDDPHGNLYQARGAIIGVVNLVGVHSAEAGCCESPWAETSYAEHGGKTRRDIVHLVLDDPRPLLVPIRCRGALGLWTVPAEIEWQLGGAVAS